MTWDCTLFHTTNVLKIFIWFPLIGRLHCFDFSQSKHGEYEWGCRNSCYTMGCHRYHVSGHDLPNIFLAFSWDSHLSHTSASMNSSRSFFSFGYSGIPGVPIGDSPTCESLHMSCVPPHVGYLPGTFNDRAHLDLSTECADTSLCSRRLR